MIAGRAGVNASPYDIASDKSKEKKRSKRRKRGGKREKRVGNRGHRHLNL